MARNLKNFNFYYLYFYYSKLTKKQKYKIIEKDNLYKKIYKLKFDILYDKNNDNKIMFIFRYLRFFNYAKKTIINIVKENQISLIINNQTEIPIPKSLLNKNVNVLHTDIKKYLNDFTSSTLLGTLFKKLFFTFTKESNLVCFTELDKKIIKNNKNKIKCIFPINYGFIEANKINYQILDKLDLRTQITYIGKLENNQKNIDKLLEIDKMLKNELGINIQFYGDGAYLDKSKLNFKGSVKNEQIPKILKKTKLLVLYSNWEGFPLSIVEALSHGVPCVILNSFTNAKFLINNERGSLVESNELKKFVDEIIKIYNLPIKKYKKMCKNCLDFTKENLTKNNFLGKWEQLINGYINDKNKK